MMEAESSTIPELPSVGQTLDDRFELRAKIGEGGVGYVFRAYDHYAGREVAFKLLIPRYVGRPERELRLLREAELGRRVQHRHLVTYLDSGRLRAHAWPFIVMPFVDGDDLAFRLAMGALPSRLAARIARQIAGAVRALHRAGVVHRDVTAMNVLMERDNATLIDLSHAGDLAAPQVAAGQAGRLTRVNEVPGTHHYMSREQANADPADPTMDVYAFGVMLIHMLTGRAPEGYGREEFIAMQKRGLIKSRRIDSRVYPDIPPPLVTLAHRCAAQSTDMRPTMDEVVATLDSLLAVMVMPASELTQPLLTGRDPDAPRPRSKALFVPGPERGVVDTVAKSKTSGEVPEAAETKTEGAKVYRRMAVVFGVLLTLALGVMAVLLSKLSEGRERGHEAGSESAEVAASIDPQPRGSTGGETGLVGSSTTGEESDPAEETTSIPSTSGSKDDRPAPRRGASSSNRKCDGVEDEARAASDARDWKRALRLTRSRKCWDDAALRIQLRVTALSQVSRHAECARLARTSKDPETKRTGRSCATAIETSTP